LTIARALSQHPQIRCLHEPRPQMIRLSAELDHGLKTEAQVRRELFEIYCNSSVFPVGRWQGESDQKYWNLIPLLAELMPGARFVWLVRDGRDVVASKRAGVCFSATEAEQGDPIHEEVLRRWMYYREDGAKSGDIAAEEWGRLSAFERGCWSWSYVNRGIESRLARLPAPSCFVRVENLQGQIDRVLRFLDLEPLPLEVSRHNEAKRSAAHRWQTWDDGQRAIFERWCGGDMDRWYPGWRGVNGRWDEWVPGA
jgi:hypothetical protein